MGFSISVCFPDLLLFALNSLLLDQNTSPQTETQSSSSQSDFFFSLFSETQAAHEHTGRTNSKIERRLVRRRN